MALSEPLAQTAIRCLNIASHEHGEGAVRHAPRYDAGSTTQPDSWLLEKCWQSLAAGGFGAEAYSVAALAEIRQPLSPIKSLYQMAKQATLAPQIVPLVQSELGRAREKLFGDHLFAISAHQIDYILHAAASAASIGEVLFATSCLERLDQLPKGWDRVFVHPDLRQVLAETVALVGVTRLTGTLIDKAVLRFTESGAQFLQLVAACTQQKERSATHPILLRCVDALQRAVLGSLHSRKIAASVFAQAGDVENMLAQVRTIATIQDAHRETNAMLNHRGNPNAINQSNTSSQGNTTNRRPADEPVTISSGATYNDTVSIAEMATTTAAERSRNFPVYRSSLIEANSSVIRQVSRTSADTDVDFLVYTLKGAVDFMSLAELPDDQKRTLINQLAALGLMSDGWTAAGATAALLTLGGIAEAIHVVEQIDRLDPTRTESVLALVNGLLMLGEVTIAQEQSQQALEWVDSLPEKAPGRTLRRGMASAYIEHNLPEAALAILAEDEPQKDWRRNFSQLLSERVFSRQAFSRGVLSGGWFSLEVTEEQLHAERVRFAAYLKQMTNQLQFSDYPHSEGVNSEGVNSEGVNSEGVNSEGVNSGVLHVDPFSINAPQMVNSKTEDASRQMSTGQEHSSPVTNSTLNSTSIPVANATEPGAERLSAELSMVADVELPPELDKLVRNLSSWAPQLLDGEALVSFYRESLLLPLLGAGKLRYAWGLLPHIMDAILKLQSNKMPARLQQICQPMAVQILAVRQGELKQSGLEQQDEQEDSQALGMANVQPGEALPSEMDIARNSQSEAMTGFLLEFMAELWEVCAERGVWPTIYAIDGCLPTLATLFGPEPVVEIAQATVEQGALWGAH